MSTALPPASHASPALIVASLLDVVAAAAQLLPWWQAPGAPVLLVPGPTLALPAESLAGWEVIGPLRAVLVGALVVAGAVALVGVRIRTGGFGTQQSSRWRIALRVLIVAAGTAAAVVGLTALGRWGVTPAPGAWITLLAGIGGAALAVRTVSHRGASVGLIVALAVVLLPGPPPRPSDGPTAGPFVRVTGPDAGLTGRSRLVVADGAPAVTTDDGLVRFGPGGWPETLARIAEGERAGVLGVAGDRVARRIDESTVAVTGLRGGDPVAVTVRDISVRDSDVSPVGTDGSLWLRTPDDPPGTVRRLDLTAYDGVQDLRATFLPVVTISDPAGGEPLVPGDLLPVPGGAVRFVDGRLERITPTPDSAAATRLAGGLDPACGLTAVAADAYLAAAGRATVDVDGGIWFTVGDGSRLVRLRPDGVLAAVPDLPPGPVTGLLAAPDGSLEMLVGGPSTEVWRLPAGAAALTDLAPTPEGCVPDPGPVGPPVGLTPIASVRGDGLGIALGVDGRIAHGRRGAPSTIFSLAPDGREVALGVRRDGNLGDVWPDGSGGVWWLEEPDGGSPVTLVHGRPDVAEQRFAPVAHPAPREGSRLVPDLGGRPPLLGTIAGTFRIDAGAAVRISEGAVTDGIVRADGRGWILAGGRLLALDGDRVLGAVIDPGIDPGAADTPVAVQLAKGVAPARLSLPHPTVGLDATGRAVVVSGGVVLGVADDATVTVLAQDPRLDAVTPVEGGLVTFDRLSYLRVDLPR